MHQEKGFQPSGLVTDITCAATQSTGFNKRPLSKMPLAGDSVFPGK
jgi:hypothetical protein